MDFFAFLKRVFVQMYCTAFGCVDDSHCMVITAYTFIPCARCGRDVFSGQTIDAWWREQKALPPIELDDDGFCIGAPRESDR